VVLALLVVCVGYFVICALVVSVLFDWFILHVLVVGCLCVEYFVLSLVDAAVECYLLCGCRWGVVWFVLVCASCHVVGCGFVVVVFLVV